MGQFPLALRKLEEAAKRAHQYKLEELELDALLYIERVYSLHMGRRHEAEGVLKRVKQLRKASPALRLDEYSDLVEANWLLQGEPAKKRSHAQTHEAHFRKVLAA